MTQRALITGGCGFIGSHLAGTLIAQDWHVDVIDDLSTGAILNVEPLRDHPRFHCVVDTIRNDSLMGELVDRADTVFHLAAVVGVKLVVEDPVRTIETNIRGAEIVLEHAAQKGKRVLIASSSEVYGKSDKAPFTEGDDLILGPTTSNRWSYACSKAVDEFLALAYHKQNDLPVVVARFFNTVGPRQSGEYGMVLPRFVRQALAGEPLRVYGDGSQTRSFCHVKDTSRAVIALMDCDDAIGQVINVGNDREIAIRDLAAMVIERADSSSEIELISFEEVYGKGFEDLGRRVPDIRRLRSLIEFDDRTAIETIIDDVVAYERALMSALR